MRKRVLDQQNSDELTHLPTSQFHGRTWCVLDQRRYIVSQRLQIFRFCKTVMALLVMSCVIYHVGYITWEAINFGDPCIIANETREQFSSSPRMKLTKKLLPLPKIIQQQWKTEDIHSMVLFKNVNSEWKYLYPEPEY
jgi:hypothetical protein